MKVAVSIPDGVYSDADRAAARQGLNRSQLYTRALRRYLAEESGNEITRLIDQALEGSLESAGSETDDLASIEADDLIDSGSWEW